MRKSGGNKNAKVCGGRTKKNTKVSSLVGTRATPFDGFKVEMFMPEGLNGCRG